MPVSLPSNGIPHSSVVNSFLPVNSLNKSHLAHENLELEHRVSLSLSVMPFSHEFRIPSEIFGVGAVIHEDLLNPG